MKESLPPIYFYIPKSQWPAGDLPQIPEEYGEWMSCWGSRYGRGKYDWTLQTYLYLKADGLPCKLIDVMPDEGIVISHRDFLDDNLKPGSKLLVFCIKVDREPHPFAQLQVVQNYQDELLKRAPILWQGYPLRFWLQSKLIPRDGVRGARFELVNDDKRYIDYRAAVAGSPRTLTIEDYPMIANGNFHFARKFDLKQDAAILDKLDALIFN